MNFQDSLDLPLARRHFAVGLVLFPIVFALLLAFYCVAGAA